MDVMVIVDFLARWGHVAFGILWIGLLYYFNFIQGGYVANASDEAKVSLFTKLLPNALNYFAYAALLTFLTGVWLLYYTHRVGTLGIDITLGATMATLMFINVWLIIRPNQQIVIASNEAIAAGGEASPDQPSAAAKALLASRTNTLFSLPMVFFMLSSGHMKLGGPLGGMDYGFIVALVIIALIEINAIFGKTGPITTVKGVIWSSVALTAVMALIVRFI